MSTSVCAYEKVHGQCCCQCHHHRPVHHHCTTSTHELHKEHGGCCCKAQKGWACAPPGLGGVIFDQWPEHAAGCEMYTPKRT